MGVFDLTKAFKKHQIPCEIVTGGGTGTYMFEASSGGMLGCIIDYNILFFCLIICAFIALLVNVMRIVSNLLLIFILLPSFQCLRKSSR